MNSCVRCTKTSPFSPSPCVSFRTHATFATSCMRGADIFHCNWHVIRLVHNNDHGQTRVTPSPPPQMRVFVTGEFPTKLWAAGLALMPHLSTEPTRKNYSIRNSAKRVMSTHKSVLCATRQPRAFLRSALCSTFVFMCHGVPWITFTHTHPPHTLMRTHSSSNHLMLLRMGGQKRRVLRS